MKQLDDKQLAKQREGHRERLRSRFMNGGLKAFQDYEILEYLLFQTVKN